MPDIVQITVEQPTNVVEIEISDRGQKGDAGADGPNIVTNATSSDGTATLSVAAIQLNTDATPTAALGLMRWNDTDKCAEIVSVNGTIIQIGQESVTYARNNTAALIPNGTPVYVSGAAGNRPTVALADASTEATADVTIGLVTGTAGIAKNADGFITTHGLVRGLNTNAWAEGTQLYLSEATGVLTSTVPTTESSYVVKVGTVTRRSLTLGEISVDLDSHGTAVNDSIYRAGSKAAAATAIDLGTTSNVTFSTMTLTSLPTADPLVSGAIWNDAGTLKISA